MNLNDLFENRDSFASQLIRQKARQLVRHPGFSKSDRPDIEQELAIELVQKYDQFDPERARETTFIARVLETLPADLRKLAEMLTEMTEYAASQQLGKSRRQVANDVARLRERFEDAGLRDYL
jgi:hypothetical protein